MEFNPSANPTFRRADGLIFTPSASAKVYKANLGATFFQAANSRHENKNLETANQPTLQLTIKELDDANSKNKLEPKFFNIQAFTLVRQAREIRDIKLKNQYILGVMNWASQNRPDFAQVLATKLKESQLTK